MITEQQLAELEERYTSTEPPPCPVCGAERSLADSGGRGGAVYACPSDEASMMRAEGREAYEKALNHYRASQWTERIRGDSRVVELVRVYRELLADSVVTVVLRNLRAEVERNPVDLVSVPGAVEMERVLRLIDERLGKIS